MTFLSLGMDIHQLRFELCSGIRLPTQSHFPSNTSKLIKECFHEDPYQRPNFKKIKKDIAIAYNELLQNVYLPNDNIYIWHNNEYIEQIYDTLITNVC